MALHDCTIHAGRKNFAVDYEDIPVHGHIDFFIKDYEHNMIYPSIIDFSMAKYEPMFNPVAYRCSMISRYMGLTGTNTDIYVFSVSSGIRWKYEKRMYDGILSESIKDMTQSMKEDRWPARFGWWCSGCYGRGICHRFTR
jgi:hypothetical protein